MFYYSKIINFPYSHKQSLVCIWMNIRNDKGIGGLPNETGVSYNLNKILILAEC